MEKASIINWNRILAWPNAFGYIFVHLYYDMKHGDPMELMPLPASIFFGVSSLWLLWHIWAAWKIYGLPKKLNLHSLFVLSSYSMVFTTIPIFSIPQLGGNPILMVIAWIPLAPHLAWNIWRLQVRIQKGILKFLFVRIAVTLLYLGLVLMGAIKSFPEF